MEVARVDVVWLVDEVAGLINVARVAVVGMAIPAVATPGSIGCARSERSSADHSGCSECDGELADHSGHSSYHGCSRRHPLIDTEVQNRGCEAHSKSLLKIGSASRPKCGL